MANSKPDKIKHIILLMLENGSFDRYLGALQPEVSGLDGVDPAATPRSNQDANGKAYLQIPTEAKQMPKDPMHEFKNVSVQLSGGNAGFVKDFIQQYPDSTEEERQLIMGYFRLGFLPAHHILGRCFRVCDQWHSSVPGPTWPNRFFALSGSSSGLVVMPAQGNFLRTSRMLFSETQPTIFSRMREKGHSCRIYYNDFPSSLILLQQLQKANRSLYSPFEEFLSDVNGPEEKFPEFVFIEPRYYGIDQNDDHPPHNVMKGQALIAKVYNAVRSKPELWSSTLILVLHDEHGGFYDHVVPPTGAEPPRPAQAGDEYGFTQYGVRVPAILISPWVRKGVEKTLFDHTSLLKYLKDKFTLDSLGDRVEAATSIFTALDCEMPMRTDTPEKIEVTQDQLVSPYPELEATDTPHHYANDLFKGLILDDAGAELVKDLTEREPSSMSLKMRCWIAVIRLALSVFFDYLKGLREEKDARKLRKEGARIQQHLAIRALLEQSRKAALVPKKPEPGAASQKEVKQPETIQP